jgi:hypothetical protein
MPRSNARLDAARSAYREALEATRANPTPEAWTRLLAAGKELSAAQEPRRSPRRSKRAGLAPENTGTEGPALNDGPIDLESTLE